MKATQAIRSHAGAVFLVSGVCAFIIAIFLVEHAGRATLRIKDVSKKHEVEVSSPFFPFRSGIVQVRVEGTLDGKGRIHIYGTRNRYLHHVDIGGNIERDIYRGVEDWQDDLRVVYEPLGAEGGDLRIYLVCGGNFR